MIKQLLSITFIAVVQFASAQMNPFSVKYNFALTNTVTPSTVDPTPPPTATGATFGSFSAVGVGTVSTSSGSFTYDNWSLGATTNDNTNFTGGIDLSDYYEVTITPNVSYAIQLDSITFTTRRSSTGPRHSSVRSSVESYSMNLPATPSTNTVMAVVNSNEFFFSVDGQTGNYAGNTIRLNSLSSYWAMTNPVTFRFYAWNAEGTAGSFRIDSVIFSGSTFITVGIAKVKFDLNSNFNIYPVPSHDGMVYIESKDASELSKIEVLDVLGNIIFSNAAKNEPKVKVNLTDMPNGNYFVRMYSGNTVSTQKIVVIK